MKPSGKGSVTILLTSRMTATTIVPSGERSRSVTGDPKSADAATPVARSTNDTTPLPSLRAKAYLPSGVMETSVAPCADTGPSATSGTTVATVRSAGRMIETPSSVTTKADKPSDEKATALGRKPTVNGTEVSAPGTSLMSETSWKLPFAPPIPPSTRLSYQAIA